MINDEDNDLLSEKKHPSKSYSMYLMSVSVFDCIVGNCAIAPLVYVLDYFDMVNFSLILCRIRGYVIHVNSMCFRYTLMIMCADRYALCSRRVSIRAISLSQIAYRSIGTIFKSIPYQPIEKCVPIMHKLI
jgi:hypothetical protein